MGAQQRIERGKFSPQGFCFLCVRNPLSPDVMIPRSPLNLCLGVGKASGFVTVHTRAADAYNRSSTLDVGLKQRRRQFALIS